MAGMTSDLEILKDIPGYKAILKSVLKSQIQLLIEQLSDHTGEETIILTASVHDGTLSHLGSITGKGFLDGRDEIKSQFLAFCLKSHHRRKSSDARSSPYQRPQSGGQGDRLAPSQGLSHKRPRLQPVSLQRAGTGETSGNSFTPPDIHRAPSQNFNTNGQDNSSGVNVKLETSEQSGSSIDNTNFATASVSFPTSLQLSHTQTSAEQGTSDTSENQNDDDFTEQTSENDESTATSIKIEPITENEMELEITGVEPGKNSVADSWGQGQVPGTSGVGEGPSNETGDQSGYRVYSYPYTDASEPQIKTENISLKKGSFKLGKPTLRIPKHMDTVSLFDHGNELLDREFRNPMNEAQVSVKSEPVDQEEFGQNDAIGRKYWPGTQTSNHKFVRRSQCNEEGRRDNFSHRKDGAETGRQNNLYRWKQWKQSGKENATRNSEDAEVSSELEAKGHEKHTRKILADSGNIPKNGENESEWKRTVVVGKPKKHSDKQRQIIREYVDDVVAQIRSQTERQNNMGDAVVGEMQKVHKRQNYRVFNDIGHHKEAVDGVSMKKTDKYMENQELSPKIKGKKKKRKRSKKSKKKEFDSTSETKIKSQVGAVVSPKVGTNRNLVKTYQNAHGSTLNKDGHPWAVGWKYHCPHCPVMCATEIVLKRHMWRHTKVKPYPCRHCSKAYMRKKELDRHMNKEHPGLAY